MPRPGGDRIIMGIWNRVVKRVAGKTIQEEVHRLHLREAAAYTNPDPDEHLYRRLTGNAARDLQPLKHTRMLEMAHYLSRSNPLARWLLDISRDLVIGSDLRYEAVESEVMAVLDSFWHDPLNNWDLKLPGKVRELALFGEQCWPVFINQQTGLMRLAVIDPARISMVQHDPDNAEQPIGLQLMGRGLTDGRKLRILVSTEEDERLFAERAYRLRQEEYIDGDCFWFTINKTSTETRGISDLYAIIDWLDALEQLLFNILDRTGYLNAFCWDITLKGMTEAQIRDWLAANPPPRPGTQFAHNENVEMRAQTPDLHSEDVERQARVFYNHILGSQGIPEHWYGGGTDVNRATAAESGFPTLTRYKQRQNVIRYVLTTVFQRQLWEAALRQPRLARILDSRQPAFTIHFPRLEMRDVMRAAATLPQIAAGASVAEMRGWIAASDAARLFVAGAEQLNVEIPVDPDEVMARAELPADYRG